MKSMILNKVKSKKKVVIKQTKKSFDEDDFDQIFKNEIEVIKLIINWFYKYFKFEND
jgi:hypothetical protein